LGRAGEKQTPTESDVAELAGVSQSAVSRAFTPGASVAAATRKKILDAARSLGYHPNLIARSLSTKRSNIIGLAISSLENPFYAQVVKELSERLSATGRHILMFAASPGEAADPEIESFLSYQIDALILTATSPSKELVSQCRKSGVPVVLINRDTAIRGVSTVRGENRRAGEVAAQFLLAGRHDRFAFIGGTEMSSVSREREQGFASSIDGAKRGPVVTRYGNYTFQGAAAAARALLGSRERPDAIFCASDYMAFAALDVARREFGLNVGEDLSIVGVDDVAEASHAGYDLTTFSQPPTALAREAVAIIDGWMAGRRTAERREVRGELVVRGTARLPSSGISENSGRKIWTP
jgi:DNA-binding LacI/PurR family transcriptional regulator